MESAYLNTAVSREICSNYPEEASILRAFPSSIRDRARTTRQTSVEVDAEKLTRDFPEECDQINSSTILDSMSSSSTSVLSLLLDSPSSSGSNPEVANTSEKVSFT